MKILAILLSITNHVIKDLRPVFTHFPGANVFAPGVMGMSAQIDRLDKVNVFADVGGSGSKLLKGADKNFGLNTDSRVFLGKGVCLMARRDLFHADSPSGVAVEMIDPIFASPAFNISVQKSSKYSLYEQTLHCGIAKQDLSFPLVPQMLDQ